MAFRFHKIFGGLSLIALVACQPSTVVVQGPPPASSQAQTAQGGVDAGGGNGYKGRPLESYKVQDMYELADVKNSITPILQNLQKSFLPLAGDLMYVLRERDWFLIPASLDQLAPVTIGVYFSTDQIALQNRSEVWIDSKLYDAMVPEDRSLLLLHEMVLGVRLLAGTSSLDQCLASSTLVWLRGQGSGAYQTARTTCFQNYGAAQVIGSAPLSLQKEDYESIRALVTRLQATQGVVDGAEMRVWLKANRFRMYDTQ